MCWLAIQNLTRKTLNQTAYSRHSLGVSGEACVHEATEESPRLHGRVVGRKGEQSVKQEMFPQLPTEVYVERVYPESRLLLAR